MDQHEVVQGLLGSIPTVLFFIALGVALVAGVVELLSGKTKPCKKEYRDYDE